MSVMQNVQEVKVGIDFGDGLISVGRLAIRDRKIYFEYDREFIDRGMEISPFKLPLVSGVQTFEYSLFEGSPGVFNDSLPDGWGRLLFDRFVRSKGMLPEEISPLDRLAYIGTHAMGALVFEPDHAIYDMNNDINLDQLAVETSEILKGESNEVLTRLIALNGSSAGARPKALIGVNEGHNHIIHGMTQLPEGYTPWMVKFPNTQDGHDAGAIEYVYALMAKQSGITMPDVHLFPAQTSAGYFATKRFDRDGDKRFHMHTASGLLHADFRVPSLDYEDLIALTSMLTRDIREVEKMFRLAVFNVLAHNRDDHGKNFSFLMNAHGEWVLSPAYDLTFSSGPGGEHSTTVSGEGRNPRIHHLVQLGQDAGLDKETVKNIIDATIESLSQWPELARKYGVDDSNINFIQAKMAEGLS